MNTLEVSNAVSAAAILVERTPETLSRTAKKLYQVLVAAGLEVMRDRGYSAATSHVTFFVPAEVVAVTVGIHPATLYRVLPQLAAAGLVAVRGHYCTHNSRTRLDGSVWTVRMTPNYGSAARVPYDYLKKQYRCLGDDIAANRTAFRTMRESKQREKNTDIDLSYINQWTLSSTHKKPAIFDSRIVQRLDLERIFDLPHVAKQDRADSVYEAALALAGSLNDRDSTRWYCRVLWALLRLHDRGGGDYFAQVYDIATRCRTDVVENFAREGNGGRLFTSRVQQTRWWDELFTEPPN